MHMGGTISDDGIHKLYNGRSEGYGRVDALGSDDRGIFPIPECPIFSRTRPAVLSQTALVSVISYRMYAVIFLTYKLAQHYRLAPAKPYMQTPFEYYWQIYVYIVNFI